MVKLNKNTLDQHCSERSAWH